MRTRLRETKARTPANAEQRAFALREFKTLDDVAGTFEGYVAVFSNLDGNGDVIDKGAFKKSLSDKYEVKQRTDSPYLFPILWQHDEHDPIGGFTDAKEDDHGLFVRGELDLNAPNGARAYSALRKGYMRGLSIGYDAVHTFWDQKRARHLTEVRLWEGSPVTFPANAEAQVLSVKSASGNTDWPITDRDVAWDNGEATTAIGNWAKKDDGSYDGAKLASVHFYKDPNGDPSLLGSYKLLFCDVISGAVKAVPKGIFACTGSHGIQAVKGVSSNDMSAIKSRISGYYARMAKQFDDTSIAVPWDDGTSSSDASSKDAGVPNEVKQLGGLQALTYCAVTLDNISDGAESIVEVLAGACGMSVEGPDTAPPQATVAALLGAVDGLPEAIKAVINAWQEFDQQTDALLLTLQIPDDDTTYPGMDAPAYLAALRNVFEVKASRQLSAANRTRLQAVADGLQGHADEVKSILHDNDRGLNENDQDVDIDQAIAAGRKPSTPYQGSSDSGKSRLFNFDFTSTGQKPDQSDTTSLPATRAPGESTTLEQFDALLIGQEIDLQQTSR